MERGWNVWVWLVGVASMRRLFKVQSMDDNCGEWVECMDMASGCG